MAADLRIAAARNRADVGSSAASAAAGAEPSRKRSNESLMSRSSMQVIRLQSYDSETATYQTDKTSGKLSILACTRERLVEYLMRMNATVATDDELVSCFIYTYDYVFSAEELLDVLRF